MNHWILQLMGTYGYVGIAFLIMIENIFPPIPSEAILTFAGFLTTYTTLHIPGAILSATFGSLLGAIFLYALGKLLSPSKMDSLISGTVGGSLLWNTILISLGAWAGASWQKAARYFGNYTRAAKIVLLIFLFTGLLLFLRRQWAKKPSD